MKNNSRTDERSYNLQAIFIIKHADIEHFIRFSIEGVEFMPRKRRYSEKRYKIC